MRPTPARPPATSEGKPTPVRESMEAREEVTGPTVAPDVAEVPIEVGGASWVVRVRGRSLVGGSTQVLLLSFHGGNDADPVELEAWVVGRALADVPTATLEEALAAASPPREPGRRPFFDQGARRERRDG